MILQALTEYFVRKSKCADSTIAPEGFEIKNLSFLIVIDKTGKFIKLEDVRDSPPFLLPRSKPRQGKLSYKTTFFLWDHIGYILNYPDSEIAKKQHSTWIEAFKNLPHEIINETDVGSILKFYELNGIGEVKSDSAWPECSRVPSCNMAFKIAGDMLPLPCCQAVRDYIKKQKQSISEKKNNIDDKMQGRCLITGEIDKIARLHDDTRISKDSKKLISFQKESGYDSYGKNQGYNAPIGESVMSAYTTALNTLLKSNSRMKIGDAATVFWAEEENDLEQQLFDLFGEPQEDDPDKGVRAVESLFQSLRNGAFFNKENQTKRFYILGLSPNSSRIAVRFWIVGTVSEIGTRISQHFHDIEIVEPKNAKSICPKWQSLNALLSTTGAESKFSANKTNLVHYHGKYFDVKPNLVGDTIRSILEGLPYPQTILQATIRRIRAEHEITYPRAALIKACINRSIRFKNPNIKEDLNMSLDENNTNIGYRLGRLFATLEKIQQEANPRINATIRDRFYGAASGTPSTVFGNLMRLKNHHLSKLDNKGRKIFFEKLLSQIIDGVEAETSFPSHLTIDDQGRFAVGYYHQMQKFFS